MNRATLIKLVITLVIFYFLFQHIDIHQLMGVVKNSNFFYIFIAFVMQLISTLIATYRWYLIMRLLVFKESFSFYFKSYFKGSFFNQVLPGSIGGDAVRIIELTQKGYDKKDAFYGIFIDRVIGLVGLLILNLLANFLFFGAFPIWLFQLINIVTISGIAGFIAMMNLHHLKFLERYRFLDLFYRLGKRIKALYHSKKLLFKHLGISMVVHIFSVLSIYFLALAVDVSVDFYLLLIAIPPIFLLTIVPISLAGWGIRESAMVGILMLIGIAKAQILAISIMYGFILIISALPGAYFLLQTDLKHKGLQS